MNKQLVDFQARVLTRVNNQLENALQSNNPARQLFEAMRYSALNGGKRIRPLLVYAVAEAIDGKADNVATDIDRVACAVELIHAYSLIHDDLPAMDDDDLRRGMPTCHVNYGEATAILAGDGLQTLAFEQLTQLTATPADTAVAMIAKLASAVGPAGMVAGQAIDLSSVNQSLSLQQLEQMHQLKTGALIDASIHLGALSAGADQSQLNALHQYSHCVGLAFQVQDDILDVESNTHTLGKRQGADLALNKPTYTSLLGLQAAKEKVAELHRNSIAALQPFGDSAALLRAIADYIVNRDH